MLLLTACAIAQTPPASGASAADTAVYCVKRVADLDLQGGTLPTVTTGAWWLPGRPQPYAVLDGEGVAFVLTARGLPGDNDLGQGTIAVRLPERGAVAGRLFVEGPDNSLVALRFTLPETDFESESRQAFLETARDHYQVRLNEGLPGAAWWRHRATLFALRAGGSAPPADTPGFGQFTGRAPSSMDDTFDLFTGSRAVAENLQLDRTLPATPADTSGLTRPVDSIAGITVAEYDWGQAVAGLTPALDPLAALIPADQHAVFFPSFQALIDMADQADVQGTPILQALSDPTGEAGTKQRYQQQLGLPMSDLARLLGPALIDSVALTGGDPYLATGSDVAIVFQAKDGDVLEPLILARVAAAAAAAPDAAARQGAIDGVEFLGHVSPDRTVSSFVCRLGDAVVVSNSEAQLRRLVAVSQGRSPALASQPEYTFFRSRYALGAS
ncbi:MAG TPA: hypothetical protein VFD43_11510, partial [Planctomycetota bacterium]|nr:hypothetical protein [Planctomycetota bacterium]